MAIWWLRCLRAGVADAGRGDIGAGIISLCKSLWLRGPPPAQQHTLGGPPWPAPPAPGSLDSAEPRWCCICPQTQVPVDLPISVPRM